MNPAVRMEPPTSRRGVLGMVGNTPLVRLESFDTGPCELFVKLESHNPGGSIKDRIALSMIEDAERRGAIGPGSTLVEATAGNTGIGLSLVAALKGYRLLLVIPDKMSQEKINHLRTMGAVVWMTRSDVPRGHPDHYQDLAERIASETGAYYVNQFDNPANPLAHETTTGPEIWEQTGGRLDAVVCGVGSGGTLAGLTRYFARVAPSVRMVLADPAGSVIAGVVRSGEVGEVGSWLVEGIGEDFVPPVCDLSGVAEAHTIGDEESFLTARALLRNEGILAGSSSGTLLAAALRHCRAQTTPRRVVTFVCDSGNKYLSKVYNDVWMHEQGFLRSVRWGDLRDLITRSHEQGVAVTATPEEPLRTVCARMKRHDVSEVSILEGDRIVGILDESDVLRVAARDRSRFQRPVREVMTSDLVILPPEAPLAAVLRIVDQGRVAIVCDRERFVGLVTRRDLVDHLSRGEG